MRYLVIGDANSMHIYNFTKNFLIPNGYEVHLLTLSTERVKESYRNFYRENGVFLHSIAEKGYKGLDKKTRFWRVINLLRKMRLMKDVPSVDVCHIHSVYKTSVLMALNNKKKYDKLILSYWGGDLLERSSKALKIINKGLEVCDVITVTVKQSFNIFQELYGNMYDNKLYVCRFATVGLECINKLSKTTSRDECRQCYNIPKDKICITCGYSAYREQHQERCIEEINKLPKELKGKLFVIVPMQYGRMHDKEYFARVEAEKEKADFDCVILKEFVPFEMSAKLAIATDIYLHLRDTDAFSNALKEHVYAGSQIIKGDWLKYIELEEMNANVTSIDDFDSLNEVIKDKLMNYKIPKEINLFDPIYDLYATENIVKAWQDVIDFAINTRL